MELVKASVLFVSLVTIHFSLVDALKSGPEEIDKSGHHGDSSSRYSAASSGLSSAAAAAAAAIYPGALNYYSGGSSSAASSYYPNLAPSPYRYQQNTGVGFAEPYERTAREYTSNNPNSAGFIDLIPAAGSDSGHGHGGGHGHAQQSHGHGGGWGWGWGHGGGGHYTKVSNTGFGLLGLLGLLSLLQSVLNAMTTTTAAGRKRRFVSEESQENQPSEDEQYVQRITQLVLPNLNLIAHASNGNVPLDCTHRETCLVNSIFLKELGPHGYLVGHRMSTGIANLLKRVDMSGHLHKHIEMAGQNGRKGLNCHELYPVCRELLQSNGTIAYPSSLLA